MREDVLSRAQHLSDHELVARVKLLAQHEREATVALIAHLAILDERGLYLGEGCPSLFTYCTQVLHLAEHAAYNRIEAARAVRRFPVILEMLANGSVTLATVRILAPNLTPANHRDLLEAARHRSKRQVEELVAELCLQPPVPSSIRRLPVARHTAPSAMLTETSRPSPASEAQAGTTTDPRSTAATPEAVDAAGPIPDDLRQLAVAPSLPAPPPPPE